MLISGKNSRRTIFGALQVGSGQLVTTVREQCRTDDVLVAVEHVGTVRPEVPKRLIWDNAPPHHPHRVRDAAAAAPVLMNIQVALASPGDTVLHVPLDPAGCPDGTTPLFVQYVGGHFATGEPYYVQDVWCV